MMMNEIGGLASYSLNHAAVTAELWWSHFKECKKNSRYTLFICSKILMLFPNQYSNEVNMQHGIAYLILWSIETALPCVLCKL